MIEINEVDVLEAKFAEDESPFGPLVASAQDEGYSSNPAGTRTPYYGYYFKILTRQGPSAAGGAKDYVTDGHMTGGFAMIAFPAKYGNSGVMTLIVDQNGIVFEKISALAPRRSHGGLRRTIRTKAGNQPTSERRSSPRSTGVCPDVMTCRGPSACSAMSFTSPWYHHHPQVLF